MYSLYLFWFTHVTELEKNTKTETDMTPKREPDLLIHCSGGIGRSGTFLTAFHHYSDDRRPEAPVERGSPQDLET